MPRPVIPLAAFFLVGCVPNLTSPSTEDSGEGSTWVAPVNTWPSSAPPANLEAEGYSVGQVMPDFLLMDQHGDEVALWQFYGSVIVLDISTMWCGPCKDLAKGVTETWHEYDDLGFMYLTLLPEDDQGQVPDQADLERWAGDNGIEAPVLSDDIRRSYELAPDAAYPRVYVIDRAMKVAVDRVNPVSDAQIRAEIEDLL